MFRVRRIELLLIGGALAALPLVVAAQAGRGTTTTTSTSTQSTAATTVPADKLIQKYTPLAGSEENARSLVTGLRDGTDITLSGGSNGGTTTTIANPTSKMGYGNVNITLALAEKQLSAISNPSPADLNSALTNAENGILTLRASGMGWGEIAHTLGFKLGEVMRADAAKGAPSAAKKVERASSERVAGESRANGNGGRPDFQQSGDRPQKVERPERPQRPERSGR